MNSLSEVLDSKYTILGVGVSVAIILIILIALVLIYFFYWKSAAFTTHPVVLNPQSTYVLKN